MNFFDQAVLPQSDHHMILIKYLLVLSYLIFIPYVSVLSGSLMFSLYFKKRAKKLNDERSYKLSKNMIDLATFNKGGAISLGLVPLLSTAFGYAQLLHLTNLNVPEYLVLTSLIFLISLMLIFTYKYTFHFKDIFKVAVDKNIGEDDHQKEEISNYSQSTTQLNEKSGIYGLIILLISVYSFYGSVTLAYDTSKWGDGASIFSVLLSLNALTGFIQFLVISVTLTSLVVLYKFFRTNSDSHLEGELAEKLKSFSLKSTLISILLLPLAIILNTLSKPVLSFSYGLFIVTIVALLILLFISVLIYIMLKEKHLNHSIKALFIFVFVIALLVIKDQYAFDTATKLQFVKLTANYDAYEAKLKEQFGGGEVKINGADIYNGRCIACHNFDKKLVGPPYKETLPKYEGKKDALVKFILNPVKVNPNYPPMPNQGLKPNEADAIADWLLNTYKTK